jgi:hypothetical protein
VDSLRGRFGDPAELLARRDDESGREYRVAGIFEFGQRDREPADQDVDMLHEAAVTVEVADDPSGPRW